MVTSKIPVSPITREQITVEHATSDWGGPIIRMSLPNKLVESASWRADEMRTFELKHTKGMEGMTARDKGHGWHVFDASGSASHDWHGVLNMRRADDTEAAIGEMVGYLNHLAARGRVSEAMHAALSDVEEALRDFNQSLEFRSYRDHNQEWPRFIAAVAAADAAFRAAGGAE